MNPENKISSVQELSNRLDSIARPLVMTNGVFDIVHRGHINYLYQASKLGASLLVAVNSDASVRMLGKGPERPIVSADDRAYVLAGLSSVNWLTIFEESTPIELIKLIRPDIYVKGGDYNMDIVEESKFVRSWGGKSLAIPFVEGFSTTSLVKRMREIPTPLRKAAFLDRDGVINKDTGYVYRWSEFEFLDGAIEAMQKLQNAGYALVIITNQSGLARGYYTNEDYEFLCYKIHQYLENQGIKLAGVYHCPHHPNGKVKPLAIDCDCRKPKHGLIDQAVNRLSLNKKESLLIGDKETDIQAARAANLKKAYLINADRTIEATTNSDADGEFSSLIDCVEHLLKEDLGK